LKIVGSAISVTQVIFYLQMVYFVAIPK